MTEPSLADAVVRHVQQSLVLPDLDGTPYRLVAEIGRGGMGVVYEAEDTRLERRVALKVLSHGANAEEARLTAQLEHPGIVPVHDAGVLPDGRLYYAMKLVRGQRLDEWLRTAPSQASVLLIFLRICEPVAFAHANGVVHRDLKPGNIMIGSFGEVLVVDWGIAQPSSYCGGEAGTPGFMPPESGSGARGDVYSLGCLLSVIAGPAATPALRSIVRKCTEPEADRRYADAGELAADVSRYLHRQRIAAHRESLGEAAVRTIERHRSLLMLIAAYLVMRVAFLIFFTER